MTVIDRSILTILAAALTLGAGYIVRALWQRHIVARLQGSSGTTVNGTGVPSLMYFRTDGCAPCRVQELQIREVQDALHATGETLRITTHDAVAETALVRELRVVTVPTTVVFAGDGSVVGWNPGLTEARTLLKQLRPLLGHSPAEESSHAAVAGGHRRPALAAHRH